MKEYNLLEALNLLKENRNLRFKMVRSRDKKELYLIATLEGFIKLKIKENGIENFINPTGFINLSNTFVIEPKEVTFLEAVEAFKNGKSVYVEVETNGYRETYTYELDEDDLENYNLYLMRDTAYNCVSTQEILEGRWFIKEV